MTRRFPPAPLPGLAVFCAAVFWAGAAGRAADIEALKRKWPPDPATGLSKIAECRFVPAEWADGDSFPARLPDGSELTVRLYGADCIELHIGDETDARRLRAQRRYFGIAEGGTEESVRLAKDFAAQAAAATASLLARPFTLHTAFSDGRGDGRFERVYAFVSTADGADLAAELVGRGLARAFGVSRRTPWGESKEEYAARLADIELAAAKRGAGAWAGTDWNRLVEQRRQLREEESDIRIATGGGPPPAEPLDLNRAARDEIMRVPGIGEALANRIIENRPYNEVEELRSVSGIGPVTFERVKEYFTVRP